MNILKYFYLNFFLTLFIACGGDNSPTSLFEIQLEGNKNVFQENQVVNVTIENKKNKTIDGISYSIDGKELPIKDGSISLNTDQLGDKTLKAVIDYEDTSAEISKNLKILAAEPPEIYTYNI